MKKYIVAENQCFTHCGIDYKGGDEIPASAFNPAEFLAKCVAEGKIIVSGGEDGENAKSEKKADAEVTPPVTKKPLSRRSR